MDANFDVVKKRIIEFIKFFISDTNLESIILGLSGGVDSSVVASLCVEALGGNRVYGLYLPYRENKQDAKHSKLVADKLNLNYKAFNITSLVDLYFNNFPDADKIRRGNMMARIRMAIIFDCSKIYNGVVAGTGNRSEILLGYFTLFGDSACSFAPIGDLYKTEVKQLAEIMKIPEEIINKKPSAGLWPGQTDEEELGFSYMEVDKILYLMIEEKKDINKIVKEGFNKELVEKIRQQISSTEFKRKLPLIPKIR